MPIEHSKKISPAHAATATTDKRDIFTNPTNVLARRDFSSPPGIRYEWQNGCLFGVSFRRRDAIEAEAWIIDAITAGYRPLYSFRKCGSGYCPNDISRLLEKAAD